MQDWQEIQRGYLKGRRSYLVGVSSIFCASTLFDRWLYHVQEEEE